MKLIAKWVHDFNQPLTDVQVEVFYGVVLIALVVVLVAAEVVRRRRAADRDFEAKLTQYDEELPDAAE